MKVRELRERPICYHSLRKAHAPRRAKQKEGKTYIPRLPCIYQKWFAQAMSHQTRDETPAMPQHEPAPIHIRIDTQEQRSGIPALLADMPQVHIELTPLRVGDYDVGGDPGRVFERKTASDFLSSLAQGRLFAQLAALRKSLFAPILLLEGTRCALVTPRCGLKASAGRSATSPRSCACRSYPAGDRRILRSWSMLQQNNARMGTRLVALPEGDAGLRCPSGRCRSCCHCRVSAPSQRAYSTRFRSLHELLSAEAAQLSW